MFLGGEVSTGGTVEAHVIGESNGMVAELSGTADEVLGLAGAAEEGERGTGMEFGENRLSVVSCRLSLITDNSLIDAFEEPLVG